MQLNIPDGYMIFPGLPHSCRGCAFDNPEHGCPRSNLGILSCVAHELEYKCGSIIIVKIPESLFAGDRIWKAWMPPVKEEGPNESAHL